MHCMHYARWNCDYCIAMVYHVGATQILPGANVLGQNESKLFECATFLCLFEEKCQGYKCKSRGSPNILFFSSKLECHMNACTIAAFFHLLLFTKGCHIQASKKRPKYQFIPNPRKRGTAQPHTVICFYPYLTRNI